jgi:Fe-S-cluster containining protein
MSDPTAGARPAMSAHTVLTMDQRLPLTCSRSGTCCHGKMVWLNPWELACLAAAKGSGTRAFRDRFCEFGGIRLRFDGPPGWKGLPACSQFVPGAGCSVHPGRPLACRLYPLGRQIRGKEVQYIHDGETFPCLAGCAEVVDLPHMSVGEYLEGQEVGPGQAGQDAYLELMQQLADGAFVLLLESGLAASGDKQTLRSWRELGRAHPRERAERIGSEWLDRLMLPGLDDLMGDPRAFASAHHDQLQSAAQAAFASRATQDGLREASCLMMALALHLGRGLGSDVEQLADRWIVTAKKHGARE